MILFGGYPKSCTSNNCLYGEYSVHWLADVADPVRIIVDANMVYSIDSGETWTLVLAEELEPASLDITPIIGKEVIFKEAAELDLRSFTLTYADGEARANLGNATLYFNFKNIELFKIDHVDCNILDFSDFVGSKVSSLHSAFNRTTANELKIGKFVGDQVENMVTTFAAAGISEIHLNSFDSSFVKDINRCFMDSTVTSIRLNAGISNRSNMNWKECFKNATNLVCVDYINTTGSNSTKTADMFANTPSLSTPTSSEQTSIVAGANWANSNPCP